MCRELSLPLFPGFTPGARQTLLEYGWPGNVRELKNVVERSMYRHGTSELALDNIVLNPFSRRFTPPTAKSESAENVLAMPALPLDAKSWLSEVEKSLIEKALAQAKFNQRRAADLLGLTYHQLRGILKKHGMQVNAQESLED
jgi:psp operon transcriptional activator